MLTTKQEKTLCKECRLEFAQDALFCPNCGTAKERKMESDPLIGSIVGQRYQIANQIGQGASGSLYLAEHVTLGRQVVVKVLHPELSRDDLAIERFRREATTVGDLDNDHIVQVFDFGRTADGRLYLAMEHLEGQSLADALQAKGRLETKEVVDILMQVGEALIEAHAMGYVHRDLRPRNLFLAVRRTKKNYLKLLDFGLAKLVEQEGEAASTSLGMTFGDPHYMSPEQARGEPVDRRADIYSMGCIAYEMLSGHPPFYGGKVFDVLTRHIEEKPKSLAEMAPDTPAWLERAIMRCLAKKPGDRYITVYRFVEALKQGTDSGVIMTDAVARRRPSIPPAAESRAMARLEAQKGEALAPLPPLQETALESQSPDQKVFTLENSDKKTSHKKALGKATVLGVGKISSTESFAEVANNGNENHGSEHVGVSGDSNAASSANLSAVWYADGESLDSDHVLSEKDREKLEKARGNSPSRTGMMAIGGDEEYEDEFVQSSRLKYLFIFLGLAFLAFVVIAMTRSSDESRSHSSDVSNLEADAAHAEKKVLAMSPAPIDAGAMIPDAKAFVVDVSTKGAEAKGSGSAAHVSEKKSAPKKKSAPEKKKPNKKVKKQSSIKKKNNPKKFKPDKKPKSKPSDNTSGPDQPLDPFAGTPGTNSGSISGADKDRATRLVAEGTRDLQAGDMLGAASKFNKARSINPGNGQALAGLGEIALSQGAYGAAAGHLSKASRTRPRSPRIWMLLGEAHLGNGSKEKAANAFKRALKLRPDSSRARNGYNEATGNL